MSKDKIGVHSKIPESDIQRMDMYINEGTYSSRSHFIWQAVRLLLSTLEGDETMESIGIEPERR